MDFDVRSELDVAHALGRDEDELPALGPSSRMNHHAHADVSVDVVHEDVTTEVNRHRRVRESNLQLIQTANGRAHCLPE